MITLDDRFVHGVMAHFAAVSHPKYVTSACDSRFLKTDIRFGPPELIKAKARCVICHEALVKDRAPRKGIHKKVKAGG